MVKKTQTRITEKKLKEKKIIVALMAIFICVAGFSGYKIITIMQDYNKSVTEYEGISKEMVKKPETTTPGAAVEQSSYLEINYAGLKEKNSDFVCWLDIPGTNISYPVVQASNNNEYLHKTFEGQYVYAGALFMDYRNNSDFSDYNTIIYGHHMNNNTMFAQLDLYWRESFGKENDKFYIYTDKKVYVYQVYAFINTSSTSYAYTSYFPNKQDYADYLNKLKTEEYYDMGITADTSKRVVSLSTCQGQNTGKRYVLIGMLDKVVNLY
ncbi:MAG: class B sortase [Erysipelotrichaceae bacterium]|nr:class B sortase [Erysipelotrichaceae bacterium]